MKIRLNGRERDVADQVTIERLLAELDLNAHAIAVELNKDVVRRGAYADRRLNPGDEIEIVTLVGGG